MMGTRQQEPAFHAVWILAQARRIFGVGLDPAHDLVHGMGQPLDLRVTLDHRDIFAEIVQNRLGNSNLSVVFPDYTPRFRNVTKA